MSDPLVPHSGELRGAPADAHTPGLVEYLTSGVAGSVVLVLLVLVCYGATLQFAYIWGDDVNFTANATLRTFGGLSRVWTDLSASPQFMPVTYTSFWAEMRLFGAVSNVSHGINVLLHAANVLLLWAVLKRLAVPGAWAAAAIFAVHPLNVETVAWVSQRSGLLSLAFGLSATLFFVQQSLNAVVRVATPKPGIDGADSRADIVSEGIRFGLPEHAGRLYALFIAMFALAALSRPSLAVLSLVLGVLVWWKKGRLERRDLFALVPPLLIGIVIAAVAARIEHDPSAVGAAGAQWSIGLPTKLMLAGQTTLFYLGKMAVPYPLLFNYPRWDLSASSVSQWLPLTGVIVLVAAALAVIRFVGRGAATAAAIYFILILPASGIASYYMLRYAWVFDHQAYAASVAPIALVAAALAIALRRAPNAVPTIVAAVVIAVLGLLTTTEHRRDTSTEVAKQKEGGIVRIEPTFAENRALWETTYKQNKRSWLAYGNFGRWALGKGQSDYADYMKTGDAERAASERKIAFEKARVWLDEAVKINPDYYEAYAYRGSLDLQENKIDDALTDFLLSDEAAARMNAQSFVEAKHFIAQILTVRGKTEQAEHAYKELQDLEPKLAARQPETFSQLRLEYGDLLLRKMKSPPSEKMPDDDHAVVQSAVEEYLRAGDLAPEYVPAKLKLAKILMLTGVTTPALEQLREALEIDKNNVDAKFLAALIAQKINDYESAGAQLINLLQVDPNYMPAHIKLAEVFNTVGRREDAINELNNALKISPGYLPAEQMLRQLSAAATQPSSGPATAPSVLAP